MRWDVHVDCIDRSSTLLIGQSLEYVFWPHALSDESLSPIPLENIIGRIRTISFRNPALDQVTNWLSAHLSKYRRPIIEL